MFGAPNLCFVVCRLENDPSIHEKEDAFRQVKLFRTRAI